MSPDETAAANERFLNDWVASFSPDSQVRLRADLAKCQTDDEQCEFVKRVQCQRIRQVLALLEEWQKPWYVQFWHWFKKYLPNAPHEPAREKGTDA
jgi:hypothetical protein